MNAITNAALRREIAVATARLRETTDRLVAQEISRGAVLYDRETHLAHLIGYSWRLLSDAEILARLESAVGAEANAVTAGRWHADSNRLIALRQALAEERRRSAA